MRSVPALPFGRRKILGWYCIDWFFIMFSLTPIIWIVSLSLKTEATINDGHFFPVQMTDENYVKIFHNGQFVESLVNSCGICGLSTVIILSIGFAAAYSLRRIHFPGQRWVYFCILLVTVFPPISFVNPLFYLERKIGIFDTWAGLVVPYIAFGLPLAIVVLLSFFDYIPLSLEQAAALDGASRSKILRCIVFPLSVPGIVTSGILVFISCWNDLLLSMSLTASSRAQTAPVLISNFTGETEFAQPIGSIAAGAVIITAPILILVAFFQKKIIVGLTAGANKG